MKRSVTLRTQLIILMVILVLLQSAALLTSLRISNVYRKLDAESYRLFDSAALSRSASFNSGVAQLINNVSSEALQLGGSLSALADSRGVPASELHSSDESYAESSVLGTDSVLRLLRGNAVTGAFFMLSGSNADKRNPEAHSAVYIRNFAPGSSASGTDNYLLEIGPTAISRDYRIATSVRWDLDLTIGPESAALGELYSRPQEAALAHPSAEMEVYGYWSRPAAVLGDNQEAVYYTLPLLDGEGACFGVVGVEISVSQLTQRYFPNSDLPYHNSFFAIASFDGRLLSLDWFMPSGPLASISLSEGGELSLLPLGSSSLYEAEIPGFGEVYCSAQTLSMYSANSPYYDSSWSLIGFVPRSVLHETSDSVKGLLHLSIFLTTVIALVAILVMVGFSTRKISGLSRYINTLSPHQDLSFTRTGMREIDDLTAALARLNSSVRRAEKTTSKILELTLMPIGGFETSGGSGTVTLTEYVYSLLGINPQKTLTKAKWDALFTELISNPVPGYENIYRYTGDSGEVLWLRILTADVEHGQVGVILDVTKEIEEHRRLSHELDYDALTHLYNRVAFKRETYNKIREAPDKIGAMIFSDIDNLKSINDNYGHEVGDRLIIAAGEMFRRFERHGGVAARISGDEFAIYLHGFESEEEGRRVISEQFRENSGLTLPLPNGEGHLISSSSGLAWYPGHASDVADLLKLSDYAMYEAKRGGKGTLFEFDSSTYNSEE